MDYARQNIKDAMNWLSYRNALSYGVSVYDYYKNNPLQLSTEILSGLSVAIMQVPESIAFSFIAGIPPLNGLYSTFFIGLFASALGGRPGTVSGIAGAMVVVSAELQKELTALGVCSLDRYNILLLSTIFCGLFEIILGWCRIDLVFKIMPNTVGIGFVNALAVVIFLTQLNTYKVPMNSSDISSSLEPANCPPSPFLTQKPKRWLRLDEITTWLMIIITLISMAIVVLWPRLKKQIKVGQLVLSSKLIPASLLSMVTCTFIEQLIFRLGLKQSTPIVGEIASLTGGLPQFYLPYFPSLPFAVGIVMKYGALLAAVAITENLFTIEIIAEILKAKPSPLAGFQELNAQGLGCIVSGLFQSIGGNTMIGQSLVNILNGSFNRLSCLLAAFFILLFIGVAGPAIELIPTACLTGIILVTVIYTFEWRVFKYLWKRQARIFDYLTILIVTLVGIFTNLAYATAAGLVFSMFVFTWQSSRSLEVREMSNGEIDHEGEHSWMNKNVENDKSKNVHHTFEIKGFLFFASSRIFLSKLYSIALDIAESHPKQHPASIVMVLDCKEMQLFDFTAVDALKRLVKFTEELNIKLYLLHIQPVSKLLLQRHSKLKFAVVGGEETIEVVVDQDEKKDIENITTLNQADIIDTHHIIETVPSAFDSESKVELRIVSATEDNEAASQQ
jgi:SulP family sulfate permease